MKTIFIVVGIVMIIEGIPYFTMPDGVKEVADKILSAESRSLRMIGLALMIGGLLIVSLARL